MLILPTGLFFLNNYLLELYANSEQIHLSLIHSLIHPIKVDKN